MHSRCLITGITLSISFLSDHLTLTSRRCLAVGESCHSFKGKKNMGNAADVFKDFFKWCIYMCLYVDICMSVKCLWRGEKGNGFPKMMLQVTESCQVGAGIHTESSARAVHVHNNCWSSLQVPRGIYCLNNNMLRILFRKIYGKERPEKPVCTWRWG